MYSPRQLLAVFLVFWYLGAESWLLTLLATLTTYALVFVEKQLNTSPGFTPSTSFNDCVKVIGMCLIIMTVYKFFRLSSLFAIELRPKFDVLSGALGYISLGVFLGLFDFIYTTRPKVEIQ